MSSRKADIEGEIDPGPDALPDDVVELAAVVRRVVASRVRDVAAVDDLVQETLAKVLAATGRLDGSAVGPYAIVTARHLVASHWRTTDTSKRHEHRLFDPGDMLTADDKLIELEEADALRAAVGRLLPRERDLLLAHEVNGRGMSALAGDLRSTPGAVAAQLNRSRAKLRVEYLLELEGDPPTDQCRPVLLSLSAGDRRRQGELDAGYHLLDCDFCASLSEPLFDRRSRGAAEETRISVDVDADIVLARQRGRDVAVQAGFSETEATVIATAISEIARNIVRFTRRGDITLTIVSNGSATGVTVVARDAGPGIDDVGLALEVGYSTYGGLGLGLPGSRRMMDEFEIISEVGRGTTVTMTKWHQR